MISKEDVYARIEKSGNLPTLPEVLVRLIEACEKNDTPLSEIASIVSVDPALSFRILQVVNSSYYGFQSTFTGIERAVVYLGSNSIKNIAVTASIHQVFDRKRYKAVKHFNLNTFWWHSLMCATLARRIAKQTGFGSPEEAYLSGLLHDIGRLILVSTFPKEHEAILLETEDIRNELWAENQLIGVTHCEAGAWLVTNWKLNSLMADAIKYHHESLEKIRESFPLVKIVFVANLMTENYQAHERNGEAGELLLGLPKSEFMDIVKGAREEVVQLAENLNIIAMPPVLLEKNRTKLPRETANPDIKPENVLPVNGQEYNDLAGSRFLAAKVKSIALLSGFLENLAQAEDTEAIIAAFEQSMHILFGIEKVLFFLPDKDGVLLKGRVSETSILRHLSGGLTLPIQKNSSLIVRAFHTSSPICLTAGKERRHLADEQVFRVLGSNSILLVPVIAGKKSVGVILLGLPAGAKALSKSDGQLILTIAQQVGLCLLVESMEAGKAEEIEAERMAAISMTARKFAHEINNPLGIINNYLMTMRLKLPAENIFQEELGIIGEEINRIVTMVNQVDIFSQTTSAAYVPTDVNKVIEDIVHLVEPSLFGFSGKSILFRSGTGLPQVITSPDALKQIMINLIKNASEAIDTAGYVEITTGVFVKDSHVSHVLRPPGIEIVVKDSGPGLPEAVVKNLYKPFVTTKKNGHSGLGLSIVHKTVKDIGGDITCTSKPGEGTHFSIYLPLDLNSLH